MSDVEQNSSEPNARSETSSGYVSGNISSTDVTWHGRVTVRDWGKVDYATALQSQMDLVELVHREHARDTLVFCTHPPVVTLGRATQPGDVFSWSGQTTEVSRGGRATYHGPSQVIVYPILDLNPRGRDLHKHMRDLEQAVVSTLADFGIHANGRTPQIRDADGESLEATGVWIGSKKIASIGIGVRKWVSFHGLALNVEHDPNAHQGLKPCGFTSETMISMEEILGSKPDRDVVKAKLRDHLIRIFG